MLLSQVVDELLNADGLAHASAAEQTGLTALDVGLDEVDDLDAGLEGLGGGHQGVERRRRMVNRAPLDVFGHGLAVNGLAQHVPNTAQVALPRAS